MGVHKNEAPMFELSYRISLILQAMIELQTAIILRHINRFVFVKCDVTGTFPSSKSHLSIWNQLGNTQQTGKRISAKNRD